MYWNSTKIYGNVERERMSGDLIELNDTELNYIKFGDEADSDNTIQIKTSWFKKVCFI